MKKKTSSIKQEVKEHILKFNFPVAFITELQLLGFKDQKEKQPLELDFNTPFPEIAWGIIVELYNKVLCRDHIWHFLYEGKFTALRVNDNSVEDVKKVLDKAGVVYKDCGPWGPDSQQPTKDYQQIFTYMFHQFSVLVMEMDIEKIMGISDRVYHCYTNMLYHKMIGLGKTSSETMMFEPDFIFQNAFGRLHYIAGQEATSVYAKQYKAMQEENTALKLQNELLTKRKKK